MSRSYTAKRAKNLFYILGALSFGFAVMISCGGQTENTNSDNGQNPDAIDSTVVEVDTTTPEPQTPIVWDDNSVLEYINNPSPWVDSVFNTLSDDEKIAQLFTVAIYPFKSDNDKKITNLIKTQQIGGLIVMKAGPVKTAQLLNKYQSLSKVPLLVATDAEWGLRMRMDSVIRFPYQGTVGAMKEHDLVYEMGALIAKQHRRVGIHVNFAPVVDINNNPNNPVIGMRSFGEDKHNVLGKGWAYAQGLQDNRVLAIAKHFPGHGDTDVDSHYDLPVISHDMDRLMDTEMFPFRTMIDSGLGGLMTTHLYVPALDTTKNLAAGLSKPTVTGLLREKFGFSGLIYTDALNMKGVTKHFPNGEIDVRALLAGNDVMLMSEDIDQSIKAVKKAVEEGRISWEEIDMKVRRILAVKHWAGLDQYRPANVKGIIKDLNNDASRDLNQRMADQYVTVLQDGSNMIPLSELEGKKVAMVSLGGSSYSGFRKYVEGKTKIKHFYMSKSTSASKATSIAEQCKEYDIVIVAVHARGFRPKNNYGISSGMQAGVEKLAAHPNSIICMFCDAYGIGKVKKLKEHETIILAYQDIEYAHRAVYQALFGMIEATGKLPVTVNEEFKVGMTANP